MTMEIDRDAFIELTDKIDSSALYTCALVQHNANGLAEENKPEEAEYNFWQDIIKSGFFYNQNLLNALGGDDEYCKWLQRQRSAISKEYSEYVHGVGRCVVAHVRRSNESGTGYKPKFSAIPLTFKEHEQQHKEGEESLKPRSWWERQAAQHLIKFAKHRLCEIFLVDSLNKINESDFNIFCAQHRIPIWKNQKT